jgi:hypothetical protein
MLLRNLPMGVSVEASKNQPERDSAPKPKRRYRTMAYARMGPSGDV